MYNQMEAILSQYEIEVKDIIKGRGSFICDTDKGKMQLLPFRGSGEKGRQLQHFLVGLQENGFVVEQVELTKKGEAVAEDEYSGERFLLKSYVEGSEISTSRLEDMKEAMHLLAIYHNTTERVMEKKQSVELEVWRRHYRELIKVRNYIRNRKKKNEFEQIYMKHFEHNLKFAEKSIRLLEEKGEPEPRSLYCHGDYNQHNILICNGSYRIVNFEGACYNWAMVDVAHFVRKMLEKNDWSEIIGKELVAEYERYRPMYKTEYRQLYGLLLFPEKFWKVTNHYMNSRKTWISERDVEKLKKVIEQEEKRLNFMENVFAFLR